MPIPTLTDEDKRAILNLCGTEGDTDAGVLYLMMMYEGTEEEAKTKVLAVQVEATSPPSPI